MSAVVVVDYDPEWPGRFREIRSRLRPAVADVALAIEHVGSTAVPGLAAKPVIDVDVVVAERDLAEGVARLARLGYEHRGDLGIPGREAFRPPAGSLRHHLYLCAEGSDALANHLAVRDHLRAHAEEARAYGELKKRLAERFPDDKDGYAEAKTDFLLGVLRRAGVDEGVIAGVEGANRAAGGPR